MPASSIRVSRRNFLRSAGALSSLALMPAASWARVLGSNERIAMGIVGTGGMGHAHLDSLVGRREADNVAVIRVCDVYRRRLNRAIGKIGGATGPQSSAGTMEYREVLDDKGVDAVLIATPDHWHTKIAIEAMEAGKDVYCEKPLSLTIEQALACRDAVKRTGRVLQVGPQGTSEDRWWKAREAIGAGRIGRPVWSQASYCRNSTEGQFNWHIEPDAGPKNAPEADGYVWWDRWLGHEWGLAEKIAWNADHFFRFRKYFAYNGGVATDLMYHKLAPILIAVAGAQGEYPTRVVAGGGRYLEKDDRDIPDSFFLTIDYPSEQTVVLASVMTNDVGIEDIIRGQYGTLTFDDGLVLREQGAWWKEFRKANGIESKTAQNDQGKDSPDPARGAAEARIAVEDKRDHMGNFLDSVRGEAKPNCNVDLGCSTMVAIKMGVEAWRRNKVMLWDAAKERAVES